MKEIAGVPQNEFLEVTEEVMRRYLAEFGDQEEPGTNGAYLAVLEVFGSKMILVIRLGEMPSEPTRSFEFCQEKAMRLASHRFSKKHASSWQSRDKARECYGGAIVAPIDSVGMPKGRDIVGSVSGLSEHGDEAVVTVIWMIFRWLMLGEARAIARISNNPFIESLINKCGDLFDRPIHGTEKSRTQE